MARKKKQDKIMQNIRKKYPSLPRGPISENANRMIRFLHRQTRDFVPAEDLLLRSILVYRLFHMRERLFHMDVNPIPAINEHLLGLCGFIRSFALVKNNIKYPLGKMDKGTEAFTAGHYGSLFSEFSMQGHINEAFLLLKKRFMRNRLKTGGFYGKSALDIGCGGGRYTFALKKLGFSAVTGIDFSRENINTSRLRAGESGARGLRFIHGNVLDLPFRNEAFDFVFCNGVLHHTVNHKKGIREMMRVLKKGGRGWLYVILSPGGLFWDLCDIMRIILAKKDIYFAGNFMRLMGCPANRVFNILDHVMVPINRLLDKDEIIKNLIRNGAVEVKLLNRGAADDAIESIYRKAPFASLKYGIGEGRFFFSKDK